MRLSLKKGLSRRGFIAASATATASLALTGCQPEAKLSTTGEQEAEGVYAFCDAELDPSTKGQWIPVNCQANCGGMCENKVFVVDGRVVRQKTDDVTEDSPANPQMRACPRGHAHRQDTFGVDRLKYPMKRKHWEPHTGGDKSLRGRDEWVRITWDEAFAIIADEVAYTAENFHNNPVLYAGVNSSFGPLAACINGVTGGISTGSTMSFGSCCFSGSVMGLPFLGIGQGNDRTDFVNADTIVLYGCNPAWASPGSYTYYFNDAKQNGTAFVFVGPEYNATAAHFNARWIRVRPGTDTAFLLAVAYEMFKLDEAARGSVIDWDFLDKYTVGIDGNSMPADAKVDENFYDYLMGAYDDTPKTAEWASVITGTPVEDIRWYAQLMGKNNVVSILRSNAAFRTNDSDDLLPLYMTVGFMGGHVGKPGHATDCAYHNTIGHPEIPIFKVGSSNANGLSFPNPVTAVVNDDEQWNAVLDGKFTSTGNITFGMLLPAEPMECDIHLVVLDNAGTINTHLNTARGIEAMRKVDFVVATARALTTQAQYADVVLPVVGEWETNGIRAGVVGNQSFLNREIFVLGRKVCEPMFETRTPQEIGYGLAKAMGLPADEMYPMSEDQQFFNRLAGTTMVHPETGEDVAMFTITADDIAALNAEGEPQEGFMPLAELMEKGIYKVPRTPGDVYTYLGYQDYLADPEANPRNTPSGKFEIYCQTKADALNAAGRTKDFIWKPYPSYKPPVNGYESTFANFETGEKGEYPYQIFNPHYLRRAHTQYDNVPWLRYAWSNPVFISAEDAEDKGVKSGDWVRVWNRAGQVLRPVTVTQRLMPGVIALPHGPWVDMDEETGIDRAGTDNMLTEPVSSGCGTAGYNTNVVNFEKWTETLPADYELPARVPVLEGE